MGLFDSAFQDAFLIVVRVGALPALDNGRRVVAVRVHHMGALRFNGFDSFLREVGLYLRIDIFQNGKLFLLQRRAVVSLHAACSFALLEVADEFLVTNFI